MKTRVGDPMVRSKTDLAMNLRRPARWYQGNGLIAGLLLTGLGTFSGCGSRLDDGLHSTDTGNPPFVDSARVSVRLDGNTIVVTGERGAVPEGARVRVFNETRETVVGTTAAADGSFVAEVAGQGEDALVVQAEANGETSSAKLQAPDAASSSAEVGDSPAQPATSAADDVEGLIPRDVDWPNVDWRNSHRVEQDTETLTNLGLWMGTGVADELDVEIVEPPYEMEGQAVALRFSGDAPESGGDIYFHLPLPVEALSAGVYFNARSRSASGQVLRVTLGGPYENYWSDVAQGATWPSWERKLEDSWSKHELTFSELGFDAEHLSPYSDRFGALHFLVPAERAYDFEILDLVFINFLPE